jgi:ribosomal protein S18 acetylase RimI-like enzyme
MMEVITFKYEFPAEDASKKKIMEMAIRNNFYTAETYISLYGKVYPPMRKQYPPEVLKQFEEDINQNDPVIIMLESAGKIVAYSVYMMKGEKQLELCFFFVKEEYRGKGIGKTLLAKARHILETVRGIREIDYLYVSSKNGCIDFYKQGGFEIMPQSEVIYEMPDHTDMWLL